MPNVLLIDPIPAPLVERLRPLFPASAPIDVVPSYSEEDLALHRALVSGKLGGAALDVLSNEPAGGNPFADLPQVIVTPHIAGGTRAAVERALQMAIANVARFLRGESPLDLVPMPSSS